MGRKKKDLDDAFFADFEEMDKDESSEAAAPADAAPGTSSDAST